MNPPPRENDVAPFYGSGEELIQRAGVIRYLAERAQERELEGQPLAAARARTRRVCASIAPKLRAAARRARACDRPRRRSWWEGVSRLR